jgi:hypothetical protein
LDQPKISCTSFLPWVNNDDLDLRKKTDNFGQPIPRKHIHNHKES